MEDINDDRKIVWVTLKSEPERPDEIIPEIIIKENIVRIIRQNEIGDEDDE